VAVDVLDHHDGVIHQDPHHQREGKHGHLVEGEAEGVHRQEGAMTEAGTQATIQPQAVQEKEDHEDAGAPRSADVHVLQRVPHGMTRLAHGELYVGESPLATSSRLAPSLPRPCWRGQLDDHWPTLSFRSTCGSRRAATVSETVAIDDLKGEFGDACLGMEP
jgi:hypothetical protein